MKKKINYEGIVVLAGFLLALIWSLCTTYWWFTDPLYQITLSHDDRELNGCALIVAIIGIVYYIHRYMIVSKKWKK